MTANKKINDNFSYRSTENFIFYYTNTTKKFKIFKVLQFAEKSLEYFQNCMKHVS